MSHRKYWYGLSALVLAVSAVRAAPPLAINTHSRPVTQWDEPGIPGYNYDPALYTGTFTARFCTDFEAVDGWDLGTSICGTQFNTCVGNVSVGNVCVPKDHLGNGNCCDKDPNVDTGWFMNGLARHCNQPHIDSIHPGSSGGQHLRMQYDPAGGSPVGCTGFGSGCRQRWSSPWDRAQTGINKTSYSYEIAFSHGVVGTSTDIRNFFGNIVNGGGVFAHAYIYWDSGGGIYSIGTVTSSLGYWSYDVPDYAKVTVEFDPCNNTITYTYAGKPTSVAPGNCTGSGNPCGVDIPCTLPETCVGGGVTTVSEVMGFTAPYGDYCNYAGAGCTAITSDRMPAYFDTMVWSQSHFNDGQRIDMDDFCITHVECPDACCNGDTGLCVEGLTQSACGALGPNTHFYPNVACAQLGTGSYPPACGIDRGSCCNQSPGAGGPGAEGTCTDGVLQIDCAGLDRVWTRGATCDPDGFASLCHIGHGMCSLGPNGKGPGYCITNQSQPCATNDDCTVQGFCYSGHCAPAATGSCDYSSNGFCQTMGRCSGSPTCNPATGAGCCDTSCAPPVGCPVGQTCVAEKQPCNAVPGGADCAFCEGCDAWPTVSCTQIGSSAECPPPAPGFAPGVCSTTTYVCNADDDCPGGALSGTDCIIPAVSPGGRLCTSNAQCNIPAAPACLESTGSCCNTLAGTCTDDTLQASCTGAQRVWTEGGECLGPAAVDCDAVLGACCDSDTFGGCTNVTQAECTCATCAWTKLGSCGTTPCVHSSIPTVSEWGIVVLTLLLLTGAKIYFGRRQSAAA